MTTFPYTPGWSRVVKVRPVERGAQKPPTHPAVPSCADWVDTEAQKPRGEEPASELREPGSLRGSLARKTRAPTPTIFRSY